MTPRRPYSPPGGAPRKGTTEVSQFPGSTEGYYRRAQPVPLVTRAKQNRPEPSGFFAIDRSIGFGFSRTVTAFGNLMNGSQTVDLSNGPWGSYASNVVTISQAGLYTVRIQVQQSSGGVDATARTLIGWDHAVWLFPLRFATFGIDVTIPFEVGQELGDIYLTTVAGTDVTCVIGLGACQLMAAG